MGIKFLTDKEASERYGYSRSWFQHKRNTNYGPPFVKMIGGASRVLYNLKNTDAWFSERLKNNE